MQLLRFSCSIYFDSHLTLYGEGKSMDWFPYDNGLRHERVKGSDYFCIFQSQVSDVVLVSLLLTLITLFSSVSIVNSEQTG